MLKLGAEIDGKIYDGEIRQSGPEGHLFTRMGVGRSVYRRRCALQC
jgi:hypothetical protein